MQSFFFIYDSSLNKQGNRSGVPRVGLLVSVTQNDDRSCKILFRNVIKPRWTDNERIDIKTKYTGVTWGDYHNGIPYDEAMDQVKSLLKDAIVVGIKSEVMKEPCASILAV